MITRSTTLDGFGADALKAFWLAQQGACDDVGLAQRDTRRRFRILCVFVAVLIRVPEIAETCLRTVEQDELCLAGEPRIDDTPTINPLE